MKILHLIASVDPEDGGPIEYARVVAAEHARAGHVSAFVTLDPPDAPFLAGFGFPVYSTGPAKGGFGYTPNYGHTIARIGSGFDAAVIHGLWNHATMGGIGALQASGLPWVIFSHGMLDPYFRKEKPVKHWIKQGFWTLWQGQALSKARSVLFTCEEEQILARRAFWGHQHYNAKVVAFCAAEMKGGGAAGRADLATQAPELAERNYLLYLSRIHPKKACDQLIEAFAKVAGHDPGIDLVMAGPDQLGWVPELQALASKLGVAKRVHWPGMLKGAAKGAAFAGARAFVLPSHQENFGIVVAEALSVGTPVLISDKVNIWREITAVGAGMVAPDTIEGTTGMLNKFLTLPPDALAAMSSAARPCYDAHFSVGQAAVDLEQVLKDATNLCL